MAKPLLFSVWLLLVIYRSIVVNGVSQDNHVDLVTKSQEADYVIAQKNFALTLNCSVTSVTATSESFLYEYQWYKDGLPVVYDNRIKLNNNGSLSFSRILQRKKRSITDKGLYECFGRSKLGRLLVRRVQVEIAEMKKTFQMHPQDQTAVVGGVARFQCEIFSRPPAIYSWMKDDTPLMNDNRHIMPATGILQITNIQLNDTGFYRCVAMPGDFHNLPNQVNKFTQRSSNHANLTVITSPGPMAPTLVAGPQNMQVKEGNTVIMECLVDGRPEPKVTWSRQDGRNITGAILMSSTYLKIIKVTPVHDGVYICTAHSEGFDPITQQASLTVLTKPIIETPPKSVRYPVARSWRMTCLAHGSPKPDIQWLYNGIDIHKVPGLQFQVFNSTSQVLLQNLELENAGYYQCLAKNEVGYDIGTAYVDVYAKEGAPMTPVGLQVQVRSSTEIEIRWKSTETNLAVLAYVLRVYLLDGTKQTQVHEQVLQDSVQFIENLLPYRNYSVQVKPFSSEGGGVTQIEKVTTLESVPSSAPAVTNIEAVSPRSILVNWADVPADKINGVIKGHLIYYEKEGDKNVNVIQEMNPAARTYTIQGLEPDTVYKVRVLTGTSKGYPTLSNEEWPWRRQKTPPLDDGDVRSMTPATPELDVIPLNASAVKLVWNRDPEVTKYNIVLLKDETERNMLVEGSVREHLLYPLENNTVYRVMLYAENTHGPSEPAVQEFSTSSDTSPPAPRGLVAQEVGARTISLLWKQSAFSNDVDHYTVRYQKWLSKGSRKVEQKYTEIISMEPQVVLKDLQPYTYYQVDVKTHSGSFSSTYSSPIVVMTKEDKPSAPRNLSYKFQGETIEVFWSPPEYPNGNITTYIVMYTRLPSRETQEEKVNGSNTMARLQLEDGTYIIEIKACNGAGMGPSIALNQITKKMGIPQEDKKEGDPENTLGIVLGVVIGGTTLVICILIVLCKNPRCGCLGALSHRHSNGPHQYSNGHAGHWGSPVPRITRQGETTELELCSPMLKPKTLMTNHKDSKGCESNVIVGTNGKRINGYVPITNGIGHNGLSNGHVTSFLGYSKVKEAEDKHHMGHVKGDKFPSENQNGTPHDHYFQDNHPGGGEGDLSSLDDIDCSGSSGTGPRDIQDLTECSHLPHDATDARQHVARATSTSDIDITSPSAQDGKGSWSPSSSYGCHHTTRPPDGQDVDKNWGQGLPSSGPRRAAVRSSKSTGDTEMSPSLPLSKNSPQNLPTSCVNNDHVTTTSSPLLSSYKELPRKPHYKQTSRQHQHKNATALPPTCDLSSQHQSKLSQGCKVPLYTDNPQVPKVNVNHLASDGVELLPGNQSSHQGNAGHGVVGGISGSRGEHSIAQDSSHYSGHHVRV